MSGKEQGVYKDSIYFITEDEQANKSIKCITEYENRTYQQNNIRNKYFNNDMEEYQK